MGRKDLALKFERIFFFMSALLSGAWGIAKTAGLDPVSLVTGSSEKGSGTTKRNTLAHAIDKLENANDFEAERIAPGAVDAYLQSGGSMQAAAQYIGSNLGYSAEELLNSHKWAYIGRTLKAAASDRQQQDPDPTMSKQQQQAAADPSGSQSGGGSTQQAGMIRNIVLLLFGGVLIYVISQ